MMLKYWVEVGTGFRARSRSTTLLAPWRAWTPAKHANRGKKALDNIEAYNCSFLQKKKSKVLELKALDGDLGKLIDFYRR